MEKVYVVYELNSENVIEVQQFKILKIFKDSNMAFQYIKNEIEFQCNNDENWSSEIIINKENDEMIKAFVNYCGEWQYTIYLKEMEME